MQKRTLNERSYFNLTEYLGGKVFHNVTSNYYPVTSAISIKDGQKLFTVMNSRSQGGSSLDPGRIELMQNRRIPCDDNKGVQEWLNETDQYGNGIRVVNTYYVQLSEGRDSLQRKVQHRQINPLQYFFGEGDTQKTEHRILGELEEALNVEMFPVQKNEVLIRIENLEDEATAKVDLQRYVRDLYL